MTNVTAGIYFTPTLHPGTHGMAALNRASYDWGNPLALVAVTPVK